MTLCTKAKQFQNDTGLGDAGNTGACGVLVEPFMRSLAKNVTKADCEEQATTFGIRFLFKSTKPREWQQSVDNFAMQSKSFTFQMEHL